MPSMARLVRSCPTVYGFMSVADLSTNSSLIPSVTVCPVKDFEIGAALPPPLLVPGGLADRPEGLCP